MKKLLLILLFFLSACSQTPVPTPQASNAVSVQMHRTSFGQAAQMIAQHAGLPTPDLSTLALDDIGNAVEFAIVDDDNDPCNDLIPDPMVDCWIITPIDGTPIIGGPGYPVAPDPGVAPEDGAQWKMIAMFLEEEEALRTILLYQAEDIRRGRTVFYRAEEKQVTISNPETQESETNTVWLVSSKTVTP